MAYDGLTQQETKMILDSLYSTKERVHNEGTDTLKFLLALLAKRLTARYTHPPPLFASTYLLMIVSIVGHMTSPFICMRWGVYYLSSRCYRDRMRNSAYGL